MGYVTAVVGVTDYTGKRVDSPRADGTFLPVVLKLSSDFAPTATSDGRVSTVAVALTGGAPTPATRTISTLGALRIDGGTSADLSADRTLSVVTASGSQSGVMSSGDFTKLGTYPTTMSGLAGNGLTVSGTSLVVDPLGSPSTPTNFTTSTNTPHALFTFAMATGTNAVVEFSLMAHCTAGTPSGKRAWVRFFVAFVNTGGTPILSTGTPNPTGGVSWDIDEAAGGITANVDATFAANSVTMRVTGSNTQTVNWGVRVNALTVFNE